MKTQIRHLVAGALYPTKSYLLPSVCERLGMEAGTPEEAYSSKRSYVMKRLEKLSDESVFKIAKQVVEDNPNDELQAAIEAIGRDGRLISDITRQHLLRALNEFDLGGHLSFVELLTTHWPEINRMASYRDPFESFVSDIQRHCIDHNDWSNSDVIDKVGFLTCSQAKLFKFLEDVLYPSRRDQSDQQAIAAKLNPILERDGFSLVPSGQVSGYSTYAVKHIGAGGRPADDMISQELMSFDETGVHQSWDKALSRRSSDPEGAITAAKTLLETVCKHILDESQVVYSDKDDLPKLYNLSAETLNLAPSQHTEVLFKTILGNCQSVVGTLSSLRNKLGDSHGQGKRYVRPLPRHAELAVNLAGTVAMFLIATWKARQP